jgi:hypothetical protein
VLRAAVPGTQVFLADDAAANALSAKRKWWHTAQQLWVRAAPRLQLRHPVPLMQRVHSQVIPISEEESLEQEDVAEVNLAMVYLFDAPPQLLGFETQDDAARCRWLMRGIGFAAEDAVPMPTQASPATRAHPVPCSRACVQTIRESLQGAGGVSVLAVRAGELDLSPARDLEELSARLRGLEGVREEVYAQQLLQALQAQQGGEQ